MKIKKGDQVKVILGKDKGREGVVEKTYAKSNKLLVKEINVYKKHVKKSEAFPKGGIVNVNRPIYASKVMLICPNCKEKTRVSYLEKGKGQKQRICCKCKKVIK
jgi:large subunit ribosomal protein L24